MNTIENIIYSEERPLFMAADTKVINCGFHTGESALKESKGIITEECRFIGKYPFWHTKHTIIRNCIMPESCRAAIWYTEDVQMEDCTVDGPKIFRDSNNLTIRNSRLTSEETLWSCSDVRMIDSEFTGDYFCLHSNDLELTNVTVSGKYSFQYCKNIVIRDSVLNTKDPFWNSENITVYDSVIIGAYPAWFSKNLKLINCKITGEQPFCYAENLVLENCEMHEADLSFEYSTVNAEITTPLVSIKNPSAGIIRAAGVDEIIRDDDKIDHSKTKIVINGKEM